MKNEKIQVAVTALMGFLSSMFGALYIPALLLVAANIIDYFTGLMASKNRKEGGWNSYKGIKGIVKKVGMWGLVIVGVLMDVLIKYSCDTLGIVLPFQFAVGCIVAVWIVCNEFISILENIKDMGTNVPGFLIPLIENVRSQAEGKVTVKEQEQKEDEKNN